MVMVNVNVEYVSVLPDFLGHYVIVQPPRILVWHHQARCVMEKEPVYVVGADVS